MTFKDLANGNYFVLTDKEGPLMFKGKDGQARLVPRSCSIYDPTKIKEIKPEEKVQITYFFDKKERELPSK